MGLSPWETSDSQLFALITGANSGLGYSIAARLIDEFITSPTTPPKKHLILILCTRSPLKTRFTISKLRAHLRILVESSSFAKKLRAKAKAEGKEYRWEDGVQRVHFLGVEVDFCDLKSVYAIADKLVNRTVGNPEATNMDGGKLPYGSPGTHSYSDKIQQDRWALSQTPGSIGTQRSWGWGLSGIRLPRIDVIILSAGIGGWTGINWPMAIRDVIFDTIEAVTWPKFKVADIGALTRSQSSYKSATSSDEGKQEKPDEPPLGQVFCSNVFGHYILAHELMPLLSRPASSTSKHGGKIVWVSSIEAQEEHLSLDDIQGLRSSHPYEDSKRLTDVMSLTAELPSVSRIVAPYFDPSKTITGAKAIKNTREDEDLPNVKPRIYLTHPGIFASDILPLPSFLVAIYKLVFLFVRWLGSPWHPIEGYKAAVAPTWLALTDAEILNDLEENGSERAKWGSATDRDGEERVMKTEVAGWGWHGHVEEVEENKIGRKRDAVNVTKEARENFEVLGAQCWTQMEELRNTWEDVLGVKNTDYSS
ncbi:hypothetical protein BJ875DRAFT_456744 [Amylocarpus encephaloides]|uniref:3-keto-steroid reductase n=1 Tax=Amylocarpus encephaloides TaxID=45428 RepID=A0A9P8C8R3_9HELO|nr:hypothetical protein BJ875DRAFT_456744 [Amylocarpus encephaloides]